MARGYTSGPFKSTGGFEIGAVGTNTSVISSTGALENITTGSFSGNVSIGGTLTVTGQTNIKASTTTVTSATAALTLTVADSGKVVILSATAAVTVNIPSATVTGQAGTEYTFIQGAACTGLHLIDPATGDKIMGYVTLHETAASEPNFQSLGTLGAGTDNAQLTLGSTATNNVIGTRVSIVGDGSAGWFVVDSFGIGFGYATT